jgi:hypothetical protein
MNASKETVNTLVLGVLEGMPDIKSEVIVCVPYPYLCQVETLTVIHQYKIGVSVHCPVQLVLFQQPSHPSRRIGFYALNVQQ